jgi:hypothetical protein
MKQWNKQTIKQSNKIKNLSIMSKLFIRLLYTCILVAIVQSLLAYFWSLKKTS